MLETRQISDRVILLFCKEKSFAVLVDKTELQERKETIEKAIKSISARQKARENKELIVDEITVQKEEDSTLLEEALDSIVSTAETFINKMGINWKLFFNIIIEEGINKFDLKNKVLNYTTETFKNLRIPDKATTMFTTGLNRALS